jgi:hypothetical protein
MLSKNEFALEQLETRTETLYWHFHGWVKVCLVRLPFVGCVVSVWRPVWHLHF